MPQHAVSTKLLLTSQHGSLGILTLNNAKAFHALTWDMIVSAQENLNAWWNDESVKAFVVQSAETNNNNNNDSTLKRSKTRAFCAGGDVKTLALALQASQQEEQSQQVHGIGRDGVITSDFFRHEYYLNYALALERKPQISIWNGLVMGGGVGLSLYGSFRIATEHTVWSMPETAIGLFPDVGTMWAVPRILPQEQQYWIVPYLFLTGHRLLPADLLYTGLATHYIPSQDLPQLHHAIVTALETNEVDETKEVIAPVLDSFHQDVLSTDKCFMAVHSEELQQVFSDDQDDDSSLQDIVNRFEALPDTSLLKRSALETFHRVSPTALIVTWKHWKLRRQVKQTTTNADLRGLEEQMQQDFRLMQQCVHSGDFYQGVRAALLDRSTPPQWNPPTLRQALEQESDIVAEYFDSNDNRLEQEWRLQDSTRIPLMGDPTGPDK